MSASIHTTCLPPRVPNIAAYDDALHDVRHQIDQHRLLSTLASPQCSSDTFTLAMIEYAARAVHTTKPVCGWIVSAGKACVARGLPEIGRKLLRHASSEEGHDDMVRGDLRRLVDLWVKRERGHLDAEQLLARPATKAVRAYCDLHNDVIESPTPQAQVAIELEIGRLSTNLIPPLLVAATHHLGPAALDNISFLAAHALLDQGHTAFDRNLLIAALQARPGDLEPIIAAGCRAVHCYVGILDEVADAVGS